MYEQNNTKAAGNQAASISEFIGKANTKKKDIERACELARDCMPPNRRSAMLGCGSYLTFLHDVDLQAAKLETGFFCRNRLCPACAWRKSAHDAITISCVLQAAVDRGYTLYFATLTAKSCMKEDLSAAISDYNAAYTALMRSAACKHIHGAIRKLEITYNKEKDWYHPHIHSIWIVRKSWHKTADYINAKRLADMWRDALHGKYAVDAQAQDVRRVRSASHEDILEFAKYPAKAADYLCKKEVYETMYRALRGVRLLTYMRLARTLKREAKEGLLDKYKAADDITYYYRSFWHWNTGAGYTQHKLEKLPEPINPAVRDTNEEVE